MLLVAVPNQLIFSGVLALVRWVTGEVPPSTYMNGFCAWVIAVP